jgi:hypothetical protein
MHSKVCFAGLVAALAVGCVWETDLPKDARSIPVATDRELVVTDDAVLAPLSGNHDGAPLAYRHATERLALKDATATARWLEAWSRRLEAEGRPDRAQRLTQRLTCAWMRSAPENGCDATCVSCAARELRLELAPFRLIAVANRTDLSVMPDRAADGGEGRLVYAVTDGPADDPRSPALPVTVIFEYAQRGTALEWSERWHQLGSANAVDFPRALAALAEGFVGSGSLAQIRTADALEGPMVLHQFALDGGEIVPANVRNTPDFARVPAPALRQWVTDHDAAFADGTAVMPAEWWASSSSTSDPVPEWVASLSVRDDFVRASCGGCHARSASGFQIDPVATGTARLSRFLSDPASDSDELRRRVEWMQLTLWKQGH